MALRKVPGAVAFGLLASLAAHTVLYGREHAMGGSYHALLLQAALLGAIASAIFFSALAWSAARFVGDGSILAARLSGRLPDFAAVLFSAAFWFAVAEGIEPHHASAPAIAIILCLALASWLVGILARGMLAALTSLVIAVARLVFSPRTPSWTRRRQTQPRVRRVPCVRRRFARPPPIAIFSCA